MRYSVLLILSVFLFSCSGGKEPLSGELIQNPNSAEGMDASRMPAITFDKDFHDFGRVIRGEKVSYNFKFTNTGKSDLIISSVSASCGCTVPTYPRTPIKPGDDKVITVTFDSSGRKGKQIKSVTVVSNTQPGKTMLRIQADVVNPSS